MVVAYHVRLQEAMAKAAQLQGKTEEALRKELQAALDFTSNGVKMALRGGKNGTSIMTAQNHSITARVLKVDPDWLATGDGTPNYGRAPGNAGLPFSDLKPFEVQLLTFFRQMPDTLQHEVLVAMNAMLPTTGKSTTQDPFPKAATGKPRGASQFGELLRGKATRR